MASSSALKAASRAAPAAIAQKPRMVAARASSAVVADSVATTIPVTDAAAAPLFTPFKLTDSITLKNRLVLPPLTRMRATPANVPLPWMATYYGQRAAEGSLLIAEATYINPNSIGYPCAPGIWSQEQVEAWKPVVKAVHDKGAFFFCQIWHCGRASHPGLQPNGELPVAPSAIAIGGENKVFLPDFTPADYPVPQELTKEGIKAIIADFAAAARNSIAAGFDGVEIHAANGYLIDQFTKDSSNKRTDEYGGSIENRTRFALEVVDAVVAAVGADKVGIRLAPFTDFLEAKESNPYATFTYLVEQLAKKHPKLAYLHMVEARAGGNSDKPDAAGKLDPFRAIWPGPFIAAGGFKAHNGAEAVASGHADLIAYGRWWIANPDLPQRFATGAPLNEYNRATFYGGNEAGYLDYPTLESAAHN